MSSLALAYFPFADIGAISDVPKIDVVSATAISHSVTAGQRGVSFQNVGTKICWYGGSTVDPAAKRGNKLFPNQTLPYSNVKNDFDIYFRCGAGDTTEIGVVEYD